MGTSNERTKKDILEKLLRQKDRKHEYTASSAQQSVWIANQRLTSGGAYNVPLLFEVSGNLDISRLEKAYKSVVSSNALLHSLFRVSGGRLVYIPRPDITPPFSIREIQRTGESKVLPEAAIESDSHLTFDLENEIPVRLTVFVTDDGRYFINFVLHHIVVDGWSAGIFISEFIKHYSNDQGINPDKLSVQFDDLLTMSKLDLLSSDKKIQLQNYWRDTLKDIPKILDLAPNRNRAGYDTGQGKNLQLEIPFDLASKANDLAKSLRVSEQVVFLSVMNILIHSITGEQRFIIGTLHHGRQKLEYQKIIGMFVRTLPTAVVIDPVCKISDYIKSISQNMYDLIKNSDIGLEEILNSIDIQRNKYFNPLIQVMFDYRIEELSQFKLDDATCLSKPVQLRFAKFDLTSTIIKRNDKYLIEFNYKTTLFEDWSIECWMQGYLEILQQVVRNPDRLINNIELEHNSKFILPSVRSEMPDYPDITPQCIHRLFENQSELTPHDTAIVCGDSQITYLELNNRSSDLACRLVKMGVGKEIGVGIYIERSIDMIVSIIAIMKAGGFYIPIDPKYPEDRICYIINDSGCTVVIKSKKFQLPQSISRSIAVIDDLYVHADNIIFDSTTQADPEDLAYLIYTSGSTGLPKGVQVEHKSSSIFLQWAVKYLGTRRLKHVIASTSICFDISLLEIFAPLISGGKITLIDNALTLIDNTSFSQGTLLNTVPSVAYALARNNGIPNSIETLCLGGERLDSGLIEYLFEHTGVKEVFNLYGPTECSIYSTVAVIREATKDNPPIGYPISGTKLYVLNENLKPIAPGFPGELYIGGLGVARGYLNRPELTEQRFLENPFVSDERMYKTGDIVSYNSSGQLEYLGRSDDQVKLYGHRIELGEVESVISRHPDVNQVTVILRSDDNDNDMLVAFLTKRRDGVTQEQILTYAANELPSYMIPSHICFLEEMPLTTNGKTDRKSLSKHPINVYHSDHRDHNLVELEEDSVYKEILNIWKIVLRNDKITPYSNFFQNGGYSLLSIQVIAQVKEKLGVQLPIATLVEYPTLLLFTQYIKEGLNRAKSSVIRLRHNTYDKSVILTHNRGGSLHPYSYLVDYLHPGFSILGVQSLGLERGEEPIITISDMALHYTSEILQAGYSAPRMVIGYSFGAYAALEIAREFHRMYGVYPNLVVIDTPSPSGKLGEDLSDDVKYWLWRYGEQLDGIVTVDKIRTLPEGEQAKIIGTHLRSFDKLPEKFKAVELDALVRFLEVEKANIQAGIAYKPSDYHGSLLLVLSDEYNGEKESALREWEKVIKGKIDIIEVNGDHYTILNEPNVRSLASIINDLL